MSSGSPRTEELVDLAVPTSLLVSLSGRCLNLDSSAPTCKICPMLRYESCAGPAGESPVRVGAEAPGSRPPSEGENPKGEAWCQKPLWREQECGLQHQVNPAASSNSQRESRAAHITVKATSGARCFGRVRSRSPRGMGSCTYSRLSTELKRPVCPAFVGQRPLE